jgi:L-seryl-tRNA(Ser) seleniumtransferase
MMRIPREELQRRCEALLTRLTPQLATGEVECQIVDGASLAGGGSTPSQSLPTKLLRFASARHSAAQLEQRLRRGPGPVAVVARVEDDHLVIDLRTVFPEQEPLLAAALLTALR